MPRHLVFHTASLRGGGAERVFALMANAMAARGHRVTLFTWNAEGPNAALLDEAVGLVSLDLPLRGEGYGKPATLRAIARSAAFFRTAKADAVFSAPEFANLTMALSLWLSGSGARFFPTYHASDTLQSDDFGAKVAIALSRSVLRRAHKAVAVSTGIARDLAARGLPRERIEVIHNPLPPQRPSGRKYDWQLDLAALGSGPVIATAGRLVPVKDHMTLLEAFAQLRTIRPARLVIFGEGPLEGELRRRVETLGLSDSVLMPGYVNDPAACYAPADLFVLTSRSEGFGNVLIEAMAAGVPVVSTDAPHGPREILADGAFGRLVPVGDADALAAGMAAALDEAPDRTRLRARADDFSIEKIADRYEALLS